MKTKIILAAGILALGASLQAATTYAVSIDSSQPGNSFGPYNGVVNGETETFSNGALNGLFCDDLSDASSSGATEQAYITNIGTGTLNATDTRFGGATGYPAATALYDELAWLGTQMLNQTTSANEQAIVDAMQTLTDPKTYPSNTYGPDASNLASSTYKGSDLTVAQWVLEAEWQTGNGGTNESGVYNTYSSVNYNDWYVITAQNYNNTGENTAGCVVGFQNGSGGCSASLGGDTGNDAGQEFLAYSTDNFGRTAAPEPASFFLIGSGLLAGGFFGRRYKKSNN